MRANRKVVLICGAPHSGTTLLGLILGSGEDVFFGGELVKTRDLAAPEAPPARRTCKLCGASCEVWSGFAPAPGQDLYEQLSRRVGKAVIVDSTKQPAWLREVARALAALDVDVRLVLACRDGRAVLASRLRKYPDLAAEELIRRWRVHLAETLELFEGFAGPKLAVRYEELCREPEAVASRLCSALALPFTPEQLEFYRREHHPLGGNSGAYALVARAHGLEVSPPQAQISPGSEEYYRRHPLGISLDLRWRRELSPRQAALFDELAGELNEPFRWDDEAG